MDAPASASSAVWCRHPISDTNVGSLEVFFRARNQRDLIMLRSLLTSGLVFAVSYYLLLQLADPLVRSITPATIEAFAQMARGWFSGVFLVVSAGLAAATYSRGAKILGSPSRIQDQLTFRQMKQGSDETVWIVDYHNPAWFTKFSMVYDPSRVSFDSYRVTASYRKWRNPAIPMERQTGQGSAAPGDASKKMIDFLHGYNRVPNNNDKYLNKVTVQFFYKKRGNEAEDRANLERFNALPAQVEFRNYRQNGVFTTIRRASDAMTATL